LGSECREDGKHQDRRTSTPGYSSSSRAP
jgi:hypothetical protein